MEAAAAFKTALASLVHLGVRHMEPRQKMPSEANVDELRSNTPGVKKAEHDGKDWIVLWSGSDIEIEATGDWKRTDVKVRPAKLRIDTRTDPRTATFAIELMFGIRNDEVVFTDGTADANLTARVRTMVTPWLLPNTDMDAVVKSCREEAARASVAAPPAPSGDPATAFKSALASLVRLGVRHMEPHHKMPSAADVHELRLNTPGVKKAKHDGEDWTVIWGGSGSDVEIEATGDWKRTHVKVKPAKLRVDYRSDPRLWSASFAIELMFSTRNDQVVFTDGTADTNLNERVRAMVDPWLRGGPEVDLDELVKICREEASDAAVVNSVLDDNKDDNEPSMRKVLLPLLKVVNLGYCSDSISMDTYEKNVQRLRELGCTVHDQLHDQLTGASYDKAGLRIKVQKVNRSGAMVVVIAPSSKPNDGDRDHFALQVRFSGNRKTVSAANGKADAVMSREARSVLTEVMGYELPVRLAPKK